MEPKILSASAFNEISHFDRQVHEVPRASLYAIGELFLKYSLHGDYCVGLLHRHFDLQDGQIMVHRSNICRACDTRDIQYSELRSHSIFLNGPNFWPFEYDMNVDRPCLETKFLDQLKGLLSTHDLDKIIAVIPHPGPGNEDQPVVETLVPSIMGMHSARLGPEYQRERSHDAVVTGWSFEKNSNGRVEILEVKECKKNIVGLHEVKDMLEAN